MIPERLNSLLSSYRGRPDELIPILQQVQTEFGYLPEEAMLEVARFTGVPEASVFAVATFYRQFRLTPKGRKHLRVCRGTSCHLSGGPQILAEIEKRLGISAGQTTPDQEYSLETMACPGVCAGGPCMMINDQVEAALTPEKVAQLLAKGDPA
jgi:NADH-quinone oxidoreductase subunit E